MLSLLLCTLTSVWFPGNQEGYTWQRPQAEVLPRGDLRWAPEPFRFEHSESVRYVDFEGGDDGADGASPASAWRHHPWDAAARGRAAACTGIHTYVFKRGVIYRGSLIASESGLPGDPIRLTSDPSWGEGEAIISGADLVSGWQLGADHPDIPEPERVWYADIEFAPRTLWSVDPEDGATERIPLARSPNWTVSDPDDVKSEWWHWTNPRKPFDNYTTDERGRELHLAFDHRHLTEPAEHYQGAVLWTEFAWALSTPFPTYVQVVDTENHGLGFAGKWGGVDYKIIQYNRYYLEDKPHYLDAPGEFWFDKRGQGGRLYLRLPEDKDPGGVRIEAGRRLALIDSQGVRHLHVTGLGFRFTNVFWELPAGPWFGQDVDPACIRVLGSADDVRVAHCSFEHVNLPVRILALGPEDRVDTVEITDNRVSFTDHGGFFVGDGGEWGDPKPRVGTLGDVRILRNALDHVGMRPNRYGSGHAVTVSFAETMEVAGNILDRVWGAGIFLFGGKGSRNSNALRDVPLCRLLVHHNKVTDSLLNTNDWGGIETWQSGPAYVYNNVSGNPGGYWHWSWKRLGRKEPNRARFGFAYYLDGAFKNYLFNNIAWGESKDPFDRLGNTAAFQEIFSFQNTLFNNTAFNFVIGSRRQEPRAGRDKFLGNVWQGIGYRLFRHSDPAESRAAGKAAHKRVPTDRFALETNAYAANVFHDVASFGVFEPSGRYLDGLEDFRSALREGNALASDLGVSAKAAPLPRAAEHDFTPGADSAAIDAGVRVFVPWALSGVVAEWNFYPAGDGPGRILDEHWYLTPYSVKREMYHRCPTFPLTAMSTELSDYVAGPLEDWTRGALRFDGKGRYAVLANEHIVAPFRYRLPTKEAEPREVSGPDLKSPQVHDSSLIVEVYAKVDAGHSGGVLIEKLAGAGYSLTIDEAGRALFRVAGPDSSAEVASKKPLNDGAWHHLLCELDRERECLVMYLDGAEHAEAAGLAAGVSLANDGDLHVGGTPDGRHFSGTIDFMRIALGSLSDARTTIGELHAWQFDGPFLRDFAGRAPVGAGRDAGAVERVE